LWVRDGDNTVFEGNSRLAAYRLLSKKDELLNRKIFTTLTEARILIEQLWQEYNQVRPHSAKNYRPSAPETISTMATM